MFTWGRRTLTPMTTRHSLNASKRRSTCPLRSAFSCCPKRIALAGSDASAGDFANRESPARPHEVARVAIRIPLQVILMLCFRFPEIADGLHLGYDLARPQP